MGLINPVNPKKVSEIGAPVISGNLRLHELRSRIFRNMRLVRVWLPPDYDAFGRDALSGAVPERWAESVRSGDGVLPECTGEWVRRRCG